MTNKKSQTTNEEKHKSTSSEGLSLQDVLKKHGIPSKNTTAEHVGETSVFISTRPSRNLSAEEITEEELIDLLGVLETHGIHKRYNFTKVISAKKLYHYDSLERLEKGAI